MLNIKSKLIEQYYLDRKACLDDTADRLDEFINDDFDNRAKKLLAVIEGSPGKTLAEKSSEPCIEYCFKQN